VGALHRRSPRTGTRNGEENDTYRRFRLTISEVETSGSLELLTERVARRLGAVITEQAADYPWMALPGAPH
jgi:hypothetical protein